MITPDARSPAFCCIASLHLGDGVEEVAGVGQGRRLVRHRLKPPRVAVACTLAASQARVPVKAGQGNLLQDHQQARNTCQNPQQARETCQNWQQASPSHATSAAPTQKQQHPAVRGAAAAAVALRVVGQRACTPPRALAAMPAHPGPHATCGFHANAGYNGASIPRLHPHGACSTNVSRATCTHPAHSQRCRPQSRDTRCHRRRTSWRPRQSQKPHQGGHMSGVCTCSQATQHVRWEAIPQLPQARAGVLDQTPATTTTLHPTLTSSHPQ